MKASQGIADKEVIVFVDGNEGLVQIIEAPEESQRRLAEHAARGVADAESICERLRRGLSAIQDSVSTETPEAVFARLGGG